MTKTVLQRHGSFSPHYNESCCLSEQWILLATFDASIALQLNVDFQGLDNLLNLFDFVTDKTTCI